MSYSNCNKLPGIIALMWLKAENLPPHVREKYIAGLAVALGASGNMITIVDTAEAKATLTYDDNGLIDNATLEFMTSSPLPTDEDIVWVAQDADGQWWLMGARERNFPVVEVTRATGTPGGDPAVSKVKITHTAKIALIPVAL